MTDNIGKTPGESQDIKDKAKQTASAASDEVKARARGVADTVATEAANYADQAKGAAAGEVKDVASALRTAADEMRSGSPQERTFSQIADGLADASDAFRDKDLGEMVGAVSDFAKRNPLAFLGGAALVGFAATRFAKASQDDPARTRGARDYGTHAGRSGTQGQTRTPTGGTVQSPAVTPTTGGTKA